MARKSIMYFSFAIFGCTGNNVHQIRGPGTLFMLMLALSDPSSCEVPTDVQNVHVVFMNHLDVGYNGIYPQVGFINNILNKYFYEYFPRAIQLAKDLATGGYTETFVYTTHPWLVDLYSHCPPNMTLNGVTLRCPNATEWANFRAAVTSGVITWQAGPMNLQTDNVAASWLLDAGLTIGDSLDKLFYQNRPVKVLSQRDVPGITAAVIPTLLKHGIHAVSVGVNPMTSPPAVPKLFTWKYGEESVMASWHPGGYPGNPGPNPGNPGGLSKDDCVTFEGFTDALCFAFRTDNSGPPKDIQEIMGYYEILRAEFPGAKIAASTLDAFFTAVEPIKDELPVVEKEIGDTWLQGISSDPRKQAEYRAVTRAMGDCIKAGTCSVTEARFVNASRFLIKLPEHTWGLPSVGDYVNWTNSALKLAIKDSNYVNCSRAWSEQRSFTALTLEAMANHPVLPKIQEELRQTRPQRPDLNGYVGKLPYDWTSQFNCNGNILFSLGADGSIVSLVANKITWASPSNPLSQFSYTTYNEGDFDWFGSLYNYNGGSAGYYKINSTKNANPESRSWPWSMQELYQKDDGSCDLYVYLHVLEERAHSYYGAPDDVWIHYLVNGTDMDIEVQWFDKTTTRLPESINLAFSPPPLPHYAWSVSKLGQKIDPMNVNLNGSQYQHGVDDLGVFYMDNTTGGGLQIVSLDVALAVVMTSDRPQPNVFSAPLTPITSKITGMAYNFYNNIWDTNYILWYPYMQSDADFKARFSLRFLPGTSNVKKRKPLIFKADDMVNKEQNDIL